MLHANAFFLSLYFNADPLLYYKATTAIQLFNYELALLLNYISHMSMVYLRNCFPSKSVHK